MAEKKSFKAVLTPSRKDYDNYCICLRFASDVFCENALCTFSGHGRVQTPCKYHPKETYYQELKVCPNCHSKCVEIFIPSAVTEDSRYRRNPRYEELEECHANVIIPYVSYEQQPYIKEQEMLKDIYSQTLSEEAFNIWKETMQRRCVIVKKKYQLLVEHNSLDSNENVPKITMEDLDKMRDQLYEAGEFKKEWRRSTATQSVDPPVMPKFQDIEVKPLPQLPIKRMPSKTQKKLMNNSKEREPTKKTPKKKPLYEKRDPKYTWHNPLYDSSKTAFTPPSKPEKKSLTQSEFNESMDSIQKGLKAQTLGDAPYRDSQARPRTDKQWPTKNAQTLGDAPYRDSQARPRTDKQWPTKKAQTLGDALYQDSQARPRTDKQWPTKKAQTLEDAPYRDSQARSRTDKQWPTKKAQTLGDAPYQDSQARPRSDKQWPTKKAQTRGAAPYQDSQARPQTVEKWPPNKAQTRRDAPYRDSEARPQSDKQWPTKKAQTRGAAPYQDFQAWPRTVEKWPPNKAQTRRDAPYRDSEARPQSDKQWPTKKAQTRGAAPYQDFQAWPRTVEKWPPNKAQTRRDAPYRDSQARPRTDEQWPPNNAQTRGAAPYRDSQARPRTVEQWPQNNSVHVFYYQSFEDRQNLEKFSSTR